MASLSEYTDTLSNARVKSHKYKIAIKDICEFLTSKSESHKTMHLIAYKGQANEWNLIWEPYEGVPISSYKIFRGEDINSLELIDNVSSSGHSYTDINAPEKDLLYQVEAVFTNPCIIANSEMFSSSKSNFYNTIYSSLDRNIKVKSSNFLYPNPAHDILYCNFSFSQNSRLIIYNVYGSLLLDERLKLSNDISDLPEGIYFVKILDKGEMYQSRLVVLKK